MQRPRGPQAYADARRFVDFNELGKPGRDRAVVAGYRQVGQNVVADQLTSGSVVALLEGLHGSPDLALRQARAFPRGSWGVEESEDEPGPGPLEILSAEDDARVERDVHRPHRARPPHDGAQVGEGYPAEERAVGRGGGVAVERLTARPDVYRQRFMPGGPRRWPIAVGDLSARYGLRDPKGVLGPPQRLGARDSHRVERHPATRAKTEDRPSAAEVGDRGHRRRRDGRVAKVRVGNRDPEGDPRGTDRGGGQDGERIGVGGTLVADPHLVEAKLLGRREGLDQLGRRSLGEEPDADREAGRAGHGASAGSACSASAAMVRSEASTSWPGMIERSVTPSWRKASTCSARKAADPTRAPVSVAVGSGDPPPSTPIRTRTASLVPPRSNLSLAVGASAEGPIRDAWNGRPRRIARSIVARAPASQMGGPPGLHGRGDGPPSPASADQISRSDHRPLSRAVPRPPKSRPMAANSSGQLPGVSTRVNRPCVSWSKVAADFATHSGSRSGRPAAPSATEAPG